MKRSIPISNTDLCAAGITESELLAIGFAEAREAMRSVLRLTKFDRDFLHDLKISFDETEAAHE